MYYNVYWIRESVYDNYAKWHDTAISYQTQR